METITIDKAIDVMKNYREYTAFSQISENRRYFLSSNGASIRKFIERGNKR